MMRDILRWLGAELGAPVDAVILAGARRDPATVVAELRDRIRDVPVVVVESLSDAEACARAGAHAIAIVAMSAHVPPYAASATVVRTDAGRMLVADVLPGAHAGRMEWRPVVDLRG